MVVRGDTLSEDMFDKNNWVMVDLYLAGEHLRVDLSHWGFELLSGWSSLHIPYKV